MCPWDQALDIVLATKGLDMRENGNVIIVAPAEEIAARERADLESRKEIKELEPLVAEYLQVNYAKASRSGRSDVRQPAAATRIDIGTRFRRHRRPHEHAAAAGYVDKIAAIFVVSSRSSIFRSARC